MRDLARFATEDAPLHPSGLRSLLVCPWKVVLMYLYEPDDEGGQAGDTGSATHVAVAELHRGKEVSSCVEAMGEHLHKYPKADLIDAAGLFLAYASDPRQRNAEVVLVEQAIRFQIAPAEEDPTQAPIQVIGTLDQVRRVNGRFELWDLKTSKKEGFDLLNAHVFQAAAYCIGGSILLNAPVHPGGLILPRKYKNKDAAIAPVHWHFAWKFEDIEQILKGVRHQVALIRSGRLYHTPNADCTWCHQKTPDICLPKLQQLGLK